MKIANYFEVGGLMHAANPTGFEQREGQIELANGIYECMNTKGQLIAEAPTGTGKSLAYLVPAILLAKEKKHKTVVVTANIALQEQLLLKDLPFLKRITPVEYDFNYAMLKGLSNYLCLDNFQGSLSTIGLYESERNEMRKVSKWLEETNTGDLSELEFEPSKRVRKLLTITTDECWGASCPNYNGCFPINARKRARTADILVVNYHLFFIDAKLRADGQDGLLPNYNHVVFDEGHAAPDIAREYFGSKISRHALHWATRLLGGNNSLDIKPIDTSLKVETEQSIDALFQELRAFYHSKNYQVRFREPYQSKVKLPPLLRKAGQLLSTAAQSQLNTKAKFSLYQCARKCHEHASALEFCFGMKQPEAFVHYLHEPSSERVDIEIVSKQIDVSAALKQVLFDSTDISQTVVSATLRTSGSFKFYRKELGMERAKELVVESPFDLKNNMLLMLPVGMPEPNDVKFSSAVCSKLIELVGLTQGRLLALFTSYKMLQAAKEALLKQNLPYTLLCQGDAPRTQLIQQFREDKHSILLGTDSLWEGVDVPGEACSAVLIDRLPFETPADPIVSIKSELNSNSFSEYLVPRAVISFRQGVGRLIRTRDDRGVVIVLDPRVASKPYGRRFLADFPQGIGIVRTGTEVQNFLNSAL